MKQVILIANFIFLTINLTAQTQFPKYSIGTDLSSVLEYQPAIWLNFKYFTSIEENLKYQSLIFDIGYVIGESKLYEKSLDRSKPNFKLRFGTIFHTKKKDKFWTYKGILLSVKSIHFSKVGGVVIGQDWSGDILNNEMAREANLFQYSVQYTRGFEWFLNRQLSIEASSHIGLKYKDFNLTKGEESLVYTPYGYYHTWYSNLIPRQVNDNFKDKAYMAIDIDLALKLNYLLY